VSGASRTPGTRPNEFPEVYPIREDSRLLVRFARPRQGDSVLEIGSGRGAAALAAARHGARRVVATDLNPTALRVLYRRARHEKLPLEVVRTDLATGLRRFDLILANPPYLPTSRRQKDPDPWVNLALDGGRDGCRITARLFSALPRHLAEGGRAYLLVSSLQSRSRLERLRQRWRRRGGICRTVARERWGDEVLSVWQLSHAPRRTGQSIRGRDGRRPAPPRRRSASSRGAAPGRTSARGAA
jgi:release factor glutamine methyltransferase